ncbi:hypothetical protein HNP92_002015 [Methanococcus maripaludis]|uniref:Uncharacterized protein n=1 Tax=Methanococcus maripaludis TaxID=39152 RepID=A0A7J9S8Q7_METMI|nr:hypothetical protein [Methanococcus maripaludis]MBB6402690.1 hypothetical protein [Methanococcus maripaludis]
MGTIEKLNEIKYVLNQMRNMIRYMHLGEIPEFEDATDFWSELEITKADVYGILMNYDDISQLTKTKEYIWFLTSVRSKHLKNLAEKINLEDYPQMHLNYLFISHAIRLLEGYYKLITTEIE